MKQSLQLKVSQQLTLTPQLQQSIRLLQLSTLDLQQEIENILHDNPMLERDEGQPDPLPNTADTPASSADTPSNDNNDAPEPSRDDESVEEESANHDELLAKHLGAKVGTTTSTGNVDLVRRLGADEVVDYKQQAFEHQLHGYNAVLGTVRGDAIEKAIDILKPGSKIISLTGPLDAAFARARGLNVLLRLLFGLMSRKIRSRAKKRNVTYSFLFVRPDGDQLTEIGELLDAQRIKPVIDKVFPFDQAKEALEYLAKGHARGKVVVSIKQ